MRAITSCLSWSSEPIKGFVSTEEERGLGLGFENKGFESDLKSRVGDEDGEGNSTLVVFPELSKTPLVLENSSFAALPGRMGDSGHLRWFRGLVRS